MPSRRANLNGCRLKFFEVEYEATGAIGYRAKVYDRPGNKCDLIFTMSDWDDLLFYMDSLFTKYNVNYPLPRIVYDKDYKEKI